MGPCTLSKRRLYQGAESTGHGEARDCWKVLQLSKKEYIYKAIYRLRL